jgi:AAA domain
VPLHPTYPIPERILTFGQAGTGKTTSWLDIAKWSARTKSDSIFYVLDTDFSVARMLPSYPEVIPYVQLYTGFDWSDYSDFQKVALQQARPQDWIVIDFVGSAWQAVQQHFVEEVFHQDIGDYFLKARKELSKDDKSLSVLDGWVDWSVINPLYNQWIRPLLFKCRSHLYATAQSDQLSSDRKPTEDPNLRSLLQPFGVKPKGQKELLYQFHTVLLMGYDPRTQQRLINTVKDRERSILQGHPIQSFTIDYLKSIASWELT